MIFPTTNTCPNTLRYPYDVNSWAEYAFYFVTVFWRRITIHGKFLLYKLETSCKNQPALGSGHCACHVVRLIQCLRINIFDTHTIELLWGNGWIPWFPGVILAWGSNYMASAVSRI
ncbi:hypothetical protein SFRURICE_000159 [Spodoptera frugiperda]|nr:hypothetical protein SFRURICE_000159 [Spodoptera frugiperda]